MSKSNVREDKTCLNCFYVVENRFCPNCGQENIETRKTFHHLFVNFIEDLTHYENSFWKTIRNLIYKPAALTKEYLSGRRVSYLAPVRLYIFISFVTFFFVAVSSKTVATVDITEEPADSITNNAPNDGDLPLNFGFGNVNTVRQLDSVQKIPEHKLANYEYKIMRKILYVTEHNSKEELFYKFKESFIRDIPKVLFIYLPIFALILWVFQSKKRWYYFDHGIFTLHYFSFLLLAYLIIEVIDSLLSLFGDYVVTNTINVILKTIGLIWMFYYFYPAHHRFYGESRLMSFFKSSVMFVINIFFILSILLLFALYTFINIH